MQILLDHPVHLSPLHGLIPLAFLGAVLIILFPWLQAARAEN